MSSVLITGANRGIGLEMVRQYALAKWQIIACCRKPEQATKLQALSQKANIEILQLDVTDRSQLDTLSKQLQGRVIDILINNAGIWGPQEVSLENIDGDEWLNTFKTNTIAPTMVSTALIDNVAASKNKIIAVVSSIMGSIESNTDGGHYIYRSSKAALNSVFKSLAIDLKGKGISVVMLHPGWVKTDMGGPEAPLAPAESAKGLKTVLDHVSLEQSGAFLSYDGSIIPW